MDGSEYVRGRAHPALSPLVAGYGGYVEASPVPVRRRQAPVGSVTLILSFGPPIRLFGPAGPTVPGSFLAGLHDRPVVTEFTGTQRGVQVDLTPLGAFTLLRRPMDELANRVPSLAELGLFARLPEQLAEDQGWPRRFARIDAALLRLLDDAVRPDPEVAWAWRQLQRHAGRVGIAELAQETGWSRRHLQDRFRSQVGLTPKTAARVLRFQRAAQLLVPTLAGGGPGAGSEMSLADVAVACGFADQPHLTREFRALAECTPVQYRAEWRATVG